MAETKTRQLEGITFEWRFQEQGPCAIAVWIAAVAERMLAQVVIERDGDEARVVSWEADDLSAAERAVCLREGLAAIKTFVDRARR